ncbi:MAG: hypothetical protein ABI321_24770 [Polyangia bacterium]
MSEATTNPRIELTRPMIVALLEDARDLPLVSIGARLGDVVALSVRDNASPDATLLDALTRGASRAVQVSDPIFDSVDYLAVAHTLACAIRHLCERLGAPPVVVLAGDRGRGAVGPAVAERLSLPHLGAVYGVEVARDHLLVDRQLGSSIQRLRGTPPVVLACVLPALTPTARASAPSSTVELLELEALHITQQELLHRRRFRPEPGAAVASAPRVLASVDRLADRLARDGVWPKRKAGGPG